MKILMLGLLAAMVFVWAVQAQAAVMNRQMDVTRPGELHSLQAKN